MPMMKLIAIGTCQYHETDKAGVKQVIIRKPNEVFEVDSKIGETLVKNKGARKPKALDTKVEQVAETEPPAPAPAGK